MKIRFGMVRRILIVVIVLLLMIFAEIVPFSKLTVFVDNRVTALMLIYSEKCVGNTCAVPYILVL